MLHLASLAKRWRNKDKILPESWGVSGIIHIGKFEIKIENDYLKTTRKTNEYYEKEMGDRKHISIKTALGIFKQLLDVKSY